MKPTAAGLGWYLDRQKGPTSNWEVSQLFVLANIEGFVADFMLTTPVERFSVIARSLAGLALCLEVFCMPKPWFSRFPYGETEVFIYRVQGGGLVLKQSQPIAADYTAGFYNLAWGPSANTRGAFAKQAVLLFNGFGDGEERERIRQASQWYFDSLCGGNDLIAFVQAMVAVEILLGGKGETLGLTDLLANRCAYLLGSTRRERDAILRDFKAIYDTRSEIVHRGKNRLSAKDQEHLILLRILCSRVITRELSLLEVASIK